MRELVLQELRKHRAVSNPLDAAVPIAWYFYGRDFACIFPQITAHSVELRSVYPPVREIVNRVVDRVEWL